MLWSAILSCGSQLGARVSGGVRGSKMYESGTLVINDGSASVSAGRMSVTVRLGSDETSVESSVVGVISGS